MNRNHPFPSPRRDGAASHRHTLAAVASALLLLAPAAGAQSTGDTATPQGRQAEQPLREQRQDAQQAQTEQKKEAKSNELERKARAAHREGDTGPVENWFGCPPKRDPNATRASDAQDRAARTGETASGDDACDPNAPANDSPQKKKNSTY